MRPALPERVSLCRATRAAFGLLLLTLCQPAPAAAGAEAVPTRLPTPPDNVARLRAIDRGMAWLAAEVRQGRFGAEPSGRVAAASLAGLAFVSAGAKPDDGVGVSPFGTELRICLDFVRRNVHPGVGLACTPDDGSPMVSHGWATMLLAEAHRADPRDDALAEQLINAVRFIEYAQSSDGGWGTSTYGAGRNCRWTALQLEALRAAQAAGVQVRPETVMVGVRYLRACERRGHGGGFAPTPDNRNTYAAWSAFALVPLYHAEPDAAAGRFEQLMDAVVTTSRDDYFLVAAFAARAAYLEAGKYRAMAYPAFCQQLVRQQHGGGSWHFSVTDTALTLVVLQMPSQRLAALTRHPHAAAAAAENPATRPVSRPAGGP
jgi:hypothetical protein